MTIDDVKKIIINSGYKYISTLEILGEKFINLYCYECDREFIYSAKLLVSKGFIECSNCKYTYPNKYNKFSVWKDYERIMWVYNKLADVGSHNKYLQISKYIDRNNKIKFKCLECGNEFEMLPGNIFKGRGCPKCSKKHRYTKDEFSSKIKVIHKDDITLLSEYINANTKIKCKCNICGHIWSASSNSLFVRGCPKCSKTISAKKRTIPYETFIRELKDTHKENIELIGKYDGISKETLFRCNICGYEWKSKPSQVLKISECLKCSNKNRETNMMLSNEEFLERIKTVHNDRYTILSKYTGANGKVLVRCNECGNEWLASCSGIMYGQGCPKCHKSEKELQLLEYIKKINTNAEGSKMFNINNIKRELDVYIPDKNIGFEFDGLYWHSDEYKTKNYHIEKTNLFNTLGIKVIHIREDEWNNKNSIVKSKIKNLLGLTDRRIFARKCEIHEIGNKVKDEFLNKNHIQGKDKSNLRMGLFYNNELVAVMTFGKVRAGLSSYSDIDTVELIRYCTLINTSVVGGFSKLLKHSIYLIKLMGYSKIKTFADLRWSTGNLYEKNGFILSHISEPSYIYFDRYGVYSRTKFQKHKLSTLLDKYDPKLSERDNMLNNGYRRYYDCGNLVYYMELDK